MELIIIVIALVWFSDRWANQAHNATYEIISVVWYFVLIGLGIKYMFF